MDVLIDLPEIEGYEYTGEYRCPKVEEYYLDGNGVSCHHGSRGDTYGVRFHILRKKRWRARRGEPFWFVCIDVCGGYDRVFTVTRIDDIYTEEDEAVHISGNYFQTKEEAEAMAEKVRALFKEGL